MLKDADPAYFAGVYIVCGYTDLRFGIDSLAAIITSRFHMQLFVPNTLFLFCGRSSTRIKGLLWEGDGFLLLYKRVESGHFTWPRSSAELRSLSAEQFHWLMRGLPLTRSSMISHPTVPSDSVFCAKQRTFSPVLFHVFHVLCTASECFLRILKKHPKLCTALFSFLLHSISAISGFPFSGLSAIVIFTFSHFL